MKFKPEEYAALAIDMENTASYGEMLLEDKRAIEVAASALRIASRATEEGITAAVKAQHQQTMARDLPLPSDVIAAAILKHLSED